MIVGGPKSPSPRLWRTMEIVLGTAGLVSLCAACGASGPTGAPPAGGAFSSDVAFLRQHTNVVLLTDASGGAQVAVAPGYQGRVMTSTTGGSNEPSFGWIGRAAVSAGSKQPHMPLADIPRAFQQGVGDTLGFVALVIALGTVIGKLLAESGGAVVVSRALVAALGERRLDWALLLSGFLIGLPVFFQVGLVLLAPVLFTIARQTGLPLLRLGIPLVAGLSAAHGLVPPHPGPLAAIERLGADTGRTLFYSLIVSLPVALVSGPLVGRLVSRRYRNGPGAIADQLTAASAATRAPSLATTLLTILMK